MKMNWLESKCNDVILHIRNRPYKWGSILLFVMLIIPCLIWFAYWIGDSGHVFLHTSLEVGDALNFYAALVGSIGTILLGVVAIWQTQKAHLLNERMFALERDKKNSEIFDLCFSFQEEIGKIFDPQCIIGSFDTPRPAINMYFAIKTCQSNAQNIRRKLMFIKDECADHKFMDYALGLAQEAATIAQQHSGPGIEETRAQASNLFKFMEKNCEEYNEKSLSYMLAMEKLVLGGQKSDNS